MHLKTRTETHMWAASRVDDVRPKKAVWNSD